MGVYTPSYNVCVWNINLILLEVLNWAVSQNYAALCYSLEKSPRIGKILKSNWSFAETENVELTKIG